MMYGNRYDRDSERQQWNERGRHSDYGNEQRDDRYFGGQSYGQGYRDEGSPGWQNTQDYGDYGRGGRNMDQQNQFQGGYEGLGRGDYRGGDYRGGYGQGGDYRGGSYSGGDYRGGYGQGGDYRGGSYTGGYRQGGDYRGGGSSYGVYGQGGDYRGGSSYSGGGYGGYRGDHRGGDYSGSGYGAGYRGSTSGYTGTSYGPDYGASDYDRYSSYPSSYRGYGQQRGNERGWWDRASDEVSSWFGDEEAARRREMDYGSPGYSGRGPQNYTRSDDRIREDVNDRLTDDYSVDASDIEVEVNDREVVLSGTVPNRYQKRCAEDVAESISGVMNVENRLKVEKSDSASHYTNLQNKQSQSKDTGTARKSTASAS